MAEFADGVRDNKVPDPTRLKITEERRFFADMLREDRARRDGGGISKLSPRTDAVARDRRVHGSGPQADAAHGAGARSTRSRAGREASSVRAECLQEQRQGNGGDPAQHDVGTYVEFLIAVLGDKFLRAYTEDDVARLGRELAKVPDRNGIP